MEHYDILIVGGGMVGAGLVQALNGQDLRIAMVESVRFDVRNEPGYDDRAIAVAQGTRRILDGLQCWEQIAADATPIHQIHVSDRGHFSFTRMTREEEGLPALGYVVPARVIGQVLGDAIAQDGDVDMYCPASVRSIEVDDRHAIAGIEQDGVTTTVSAQLVVAADGADSLVREQFGIEVMTSDYGQTAVITNITPQLPHRNIAYERFTGTGPLALLPMSEQRCAVVWTLAPAQADEIMSLADDEFLARLQACFGFRLGRLQRVGRRQAWPLRLVKAKVSIHERLALVGNASHTLHPIAGQGFNLGARDIAVLAEVIVDALRGGEDPGGAGVLQRYAAWRAADHRRVTAFTDGMVRLFTVPLPALAPIRGAGMLVLDLLPPVKRLLTRMTMGRGGRVPRLARGLPL
ncbi:MAG: 2-octaprenyl-6-methoxyphenyl hydroxylase [Pseudomonadota bacterium]